MNAHLAAGDAPVRSLLAAFFRLDAGEDVPSGVRRHLHYLTWGAVDAAGPCTTRCSIRERPAKGSSGSTGVAAAMTRACGARFAKCSHVPRPDSLLRTGSAVRLGRLFHRTKVATRHGVAASRAPAPTTRWKASRRLPRIR